MESPKMPKTFLVVSSEMPILKNHKRGNAVIKEISHIVEKGRVSKSDSSDSPSEKKELVRQDTEPEILEHILEMEKQVIEIIQTTNNLKIECFKCMDCFKGNKDNKADLKATIV